MFMCTLKVTREESRVPRNIFRLYGSTPDYSEDNSGHECNSTDSFNLWAVGKRMQLSVWSMLVWGSSTHHSTPAGQRPWTCCSINTHDQQCSSYKERKSESKTLALTNECRTQVTMCDQLHCPIVGLGLCDKFGVGYFQVVTVTSPDEISELWAGVLKAECSILWCDGLK